VAPKPAVPGTIMGINALDQHQLPTLDMRNTYCGAASAHLICSTRMAVARACIHCCKDSFHSGVMMAPWSSECCSTQRSGATVAHKRACCRSSRALRKALQTNGRQMPVLCSRKKYDFLGSRDTAKSEVLQQLQQRNAPADRR
jgi:hypothetical protein